MATVCSSNTNTSVHIDEESEDILALPKEQKDVYMSSVEPSEDVAEDSMKDGSEMTAAAALTSLVSSPSPPLDETERDQEEEAKEKEFTIPQRLTKSGRKRAVPFTLKLMEVLSRKEYNEIIAWTPSGKAFNIINPKEFTADILPTHFKSAKYSSFTRKLHRWGFIRHYRGEEAGAFHHKYFQKDRLELVEKMTCYKEQGDKPQATMKSEEKTKGLAPGSSPVAPRKVLPKATPNVLPPMPSRFLSSMSGWSVNPSIPQNGLNNASADLNAVIEMEVSRRLKERVSAAAMSREALVIMQQQMKPPSTYTDQRYLALLQQGSVPSRLIGNNLLEAYKEVAYKQQFNSTAAGFAALNVGPDQRQRMGTLPITNIRSAKTA